MAKTYPWSRDRDRWLVALAAGLSATILVVLAFVLVQSEAMPEPEPRPAGSGPDAEEPPPFAQSDPIVSDRNDPFGTGAGDQDRALATFSATESGVTEPFEFPDGLVILRVVHNGTGRFEVQLVPEGGQGIPVLFGDGTYRAVRAAGIPGGTYRLEVDATGPWAVGVEQPEFSDPEPMPASVEGDGESVSEPIDIDDGTLDISVSTENGESLFLRILDDEGQLLTEQELDHGQNDVEGVEAGAVIFDVRADGLWRLHVRQ